MRSPAAMLCWVVAASCGGVPAEDAAGPRWNVVLIVVDTLRADHLSCYGYERKTTPNVDALAAAGWRFERAFSQAPWTTPSIGSLLSSRYPSELGIEDEHSMLSAELVLLPEVLRAAGYATGAVVSHSFCSAEWGFAQGFDVFDQTNVLGHTGISSPGVTRAGLDFLENHREGPFFLWLHYFDPHHQYIPHSQFGEPAPPGYRGRVTPRTSFRKLQELAGDLTPDELEQVVRFYDSEVTFTDHHVGRILTGLEQLGLADRTVVVFTADHGEEFVDHGQVGHAHSLYQELVHVPLIVRIPGQGPRVLAEPVGLIDVYPTVLDLLGLQAPEGLVGRSLLSGPLDRPVFTETSRKARLRAVVRGNWKLIRDLESGTDEFYDLALDPREQRPEAGAPAPEVANALEAWLGELAASPVHAPRLELDPDQLEQLEQLGYAGDGE